MTKKEKIIAFLLIFPSILGVFVFYLIPFVDVLMRSFKAEFGNDFIWFQNYRSVLTNKAFLIAFKNTIKFILVNIPVLLAFSLLITLLIDYTKAHGKLYKQMFLLPMAIPVASLVVVWRIIFHQNGLLNKILSIFDITGADYFNSGYAFAVLGITYIWRNFGYNMILWQTGMDGIDPNIYEAASLDGAGYLKSVFYITLPQLKDMGFIIAIISVLNSFKVFREAYLIAGDYPNKSIYMLQHLYNNWFVNLELGKLSAGAVMLAIVVFIFIAGLKKFYVPGDKEG